MKKYRAKIDTPWCDKNDIFSSNENGFYRVLGRYISPESYPDLFEEIEEKSDVEKLADWLHVIAFGCDTVMECNIKLAKALLEKGFDVSKLGDE